MRIAGFGASAAVLAGCSSGTPPMQPSVTTSPVAPTTAAEPHPIDYSALAKQLAGKLLTPGVTGYDTARLAYNPRFDGQQPGAVALCQRPEDVQACVVSAAGSTTPLAARGGGHSYAGYSNPTGALVADLSGLSAISVQADGTAVIGAGARLIDVYAALANSGRCLPAGSCPSVGVAGLTLGGGIGVLTRKYGLTCDRLLSASIVTADGQLRTASAGSEPDLFWGLRGGGGGNFGIATSFTFSTAPAPELVIFDVTFPAGSAPEVLGGWQQWMVNAPDELWSNCHIIGGNSVGSSITGCFVGSVTVLNPMLDDLVRRTNTRATMRSVQGKSYLDAMRYFAGCSTRTVTQCHLQSAGGQLSRESSVASSSVLATPLADPSKLTSLANGHPGLTLIIDSLGGAAGRVAANATAFPHRTALATIQIYQGVGSASAATAIQTVNDVRNNLTQLLGLGGYVNYIDPNMPNWGQAYYGDNLTRLKQIAAHYDPNDLFAFSQSISKA